MAIRTLFSAVFLSSAALTFGQPAKPAAKPVSIVRPGPPGKPPTKLTPEKAAAQTFQVADPDVTFMQGMIHHHAQAVEMVALLRTRGASKDLLAFGERITISQSDEIDSMKAWLVDRGKPTALPHQHHHGAYHLMPGMLTPEQMTALAAAKGPAFDHLFLTGMIQHHQGALDMVEDLFKQPGAGQDPALFDFATDVDNTQRAEIETMRGMLKKEAR
jgi:uncharacterized protein (DUF305 family)